MIEKLFQNLIEDTSFFYDQRRHLLNKSGFHWKELASVEKRLKKNLNSFFPEKNRDALDFCLSIKDTCDFSEFYVVIAIIIRSKAIDELKQIIEIPAFLEDKNKLTAVTDALKFHDIPEEWIESFIDGMHTNPNYIPVILEICGFKGITLSRDNLEYITKNSEQKERLIWYLGRIKQYNIDFMDYLTSEDLEVYRETAISILRLKNETLTRELYKDLHTKNWAVIPKALTGSEEFESEILNQFKDEQTEGTVLALALTGKVKYFSELLETLKNDDLKEYGALALHLLTGAGITEEVFIFEKIDEDLLFDDEKKKLDEGKNPYAEGEEPGEKTTIISQNPLNWQNWLNENRNRFNENVRYRLGLPFSGKALIEVLKSNLPIHLRRIAYEELCIFNDIDIPYQPDMFVEEQIKAIKDMEKNLS
ncbi:MAG: hypothetical protein GY714_09820 [Desulfobacterales bacterium]|nr:hypothetical protein [Desulfobacterales bacterium]